MENEGFIKVISLKQLTISGDSMVMSSTVTEGNLSRLRARDLIQSESATLDKFADGFSNWKSDTLSLRTDRENVQRRFLRDAMRSEMDICPLGHVGGETVIDANRW